MFKIKIVSMENGEKLLYVTIAFLLLIFTESRAEVPLTSPPKVGFIPEQTAKERIKIYGETCSNCGVIVEVNDKRFTSQAKDDGKFQIDVKLEENSENIVRIYGKRKERTTPFVEFRVIHRSLPEVNSIDIPPAVDIGSIPAYTNEPAVSIFGRTVPKTKVVATGGSTPAQTFSDENGFFEITVFLNFDRLNEISVFAGDERGLVSPTANIKVYQITRAPPTPRVDNIPKKTNKEKIELKGESVHGLKIVAELPAGGKVEKIVGKEGKFSIDILLLPNSPNEINIFASDPAGNTSAPLKAFIYHDSVPPDPPKAEIYPAKAYQNRITVIGKGEPNARVIAKISGSEFEVGRVSSLGDFVAEVPVFKYKGQVRRNFINLFLEDDAGNISSPTLIIVDALPDIKRTYVNFGLGFHTFLGIFKFEKEFFRDINKKATDFWGISFETSFSQLLQRGSGLEIQGILGLTHSLSNVREERLPQGFEIAGNPQEIMRITLSTVYFALSMNVRLLFENFELNAGPGIGPILLVKTAPRAFAEEQLIRQESIIFTGYNIRLGLTLGYSITDSFGVHVGTSFSYAPIRNVNEGGASLDAGGLNTKAGISFKF